MNSTASGPIPEDERHSDGPEWLEGPDSTVLALHDLGGEGPGLLFAHATGLHGRIWDPVARRLPDWRSHAVDLRGHGYSPLPAGDDLAWAGFGRDAGAAADHLGPGLVGVGHSLGAVALLMAAADRPGRFSVLVLYEPAMRTESGVLPAELLAYQQAMAATSQARRSVFPSRAAALATYAGKPPFSGILAEAVYAYVEHGFVDTADGRVKLRCSPRVESGAFSRTHDHNLLGRLDEVTCPVYVVRGDETMPEQRRNSDNLAGMFGRAALVLDGADHFGALAQPSRFARIVHEAATAVGSPAAAIPLT